MNQPPLPGQTPLTLHHLPTDALTAAGLNLVAVLPLSALHEEMCQRLISTGHDLGRYRQVLLFGHGGTALWRRLSPQALVTEHPVDDYTVVAVRQLLDAALPFARYEILYPGSTSIDLQSFGTLAGWHHRSPFWVGINARYGSWFAYRALVLADSEFPLTEPWQERSPCDSCEEKACVAACPAGALSSGTLDLPRCIAWRRQPGSPCRHQCLARNACPAGAEHRYDSDQMRHHYAASLKFIEALPD
jgi:epoxyqueuosine reductase